MQYTLAKRRHKHHSRSAGVQSFAQLTRQPCSEDEQRCMTSPSFGVWRARKDKGLSPLHQAFRKSVHRLLPAGQCWRNPVQSGARRRAAAESLLNMQHVTNLTNLTHFDVNQTAPSGMMRVHPGFRNDAVCRLNRQLRQRHFPSTTGTSNPSLVRVNSP